jgi:hypothetical protein
MRLIEDLMVGRRTAFFSCLKSDNFGQEGVFPNSLCHISDEMRHSPVSGSEKLPEGQFEEEKGSFSRPSKF